MFTFFASSCSRFHEFSKLSLPSFLQTFADFFGPSGFNSRQLLLYVFVSLHSLPLRLCVSILSLFRTIFLIFYQFLHLLFRISCSNAPVGWKWAEFREMRSFSAIQHADVKVHFRKTVKIWLYSKFTLILMDTNITIKLNVNSFG